ncbi:MAG: prepilin-type N-terminal cleavage/methylation domain-containing protein [Rhodobiaceae bacterium]
MARQPAEIKQQQAGFSLVEVMVALGIITAGIVGTLSLISANRALVENAWSQRRMMMVADSVMGEIALRYRRGETLSSVADYDFDNDAENYEFDALFSDNGMDADMADLSISAGVSPVVWQVELQLVTPAGRRMTRNMNLYAPLE